MSHVQSIVIGWLPCRPSDANWKPSVCNQVGTDLLWHCHRWALVSHDVTKRLYGGGYDWHVWERWSSRCRGVPIVGMRTHWEVSWTEVFHRPVSKSLYSTVCKKYTVHNGHIMVEIIIGDNSIVNTLLHILSIICETVPCVTAPNNYSSNCKD